MGVLSSPTLVSLLSNVRTLLNQPNPGNSFWSDEELTNWLNEAVRVYFLEVVQHNEGQFVGQSDLDIVSGSDTVSLPSDCFQVIRLYKKVNNGYEMLPYRNNVTESYSTQGGTSGNNYQGYYYFQGNSLVLRPTPNFSETGGLRLEYTQFPATMINGGDAMTAQVSPIFKQVIEMYAVYKAKVKESLVNGVAVHEIASQHLAGLAAQFKEAVSNRSKNPTYVIPYNPEGA